MKERIREEKKNGWKVVAIIFIILYIINLLVIGFFYLEKEVLKEQFYETLDDYKKCADNLEEALDLLEDYSNALDRCKNLYQNCEASR